MLHTGIFYTIELLFMRFMEQGIQMKANYFKEILKIWKKNEFLVIFWFKFRKILLIESVKKIERLKNMVCMFRPRRFFICPTFQRVRAITRRTSKTGYGTTVRKARSHTQPPRWPDTLTPPTAPEVPYGIVISSRETLWFQST